MILLEIIFAMEMPMQGLELADTFLTMKNVGVAFNTEPEFLIKTVVNIGKTRFVEKPIEQIISCLFVLDAQMNIFEKLAQNSLKRDGNKYWNFLAANCTDVFLASSWKDFCDNSTKKLSQIHKCITTYNKHPNVCEDLQKLIGVQFSVPPPPPLSPLPLRFAAAKKPEKINAQLPPSGKFLEELANAKLKKTIIEERPKNVTDQITAKLQEFQKDPKKFFALQKERKKNTKPKAPPNLLKKPLKIPEPITASPKITSDMLLANRDKINQNCKAAEYNKISLDKFVKGDGLSFAQKKWFLALKEHTVDDEQDFEEFKQDIAKPLASDDINLDILDDIIRPDEISIYETLYNLGSTQASIWAIDALSSYILPTDSGRGLLYYFWPATPIKNQPFTEISQDEIDDKITYGISQETFGATDKPETDNDSSIQSITENVAHSNEDSDFTYQHCLRTHEEIEATKKNFWQENVQTINKQWQNQVEVVVRKLLPIRQRIIDLILKENAPVLLQQFIAEYSVDFLQITDSNLQLEYKKLINTINFVVDIKPMEAIKTALRKFQQEVYKISKTKDSKEITEETKDLEQEMLSPRATEVNVPEEIRDHVLSLGMNFDKHAEQYFDDKIHKLFLSEIDVMQGSKKNQLQNFIADMNSIADRAKEINELKNQTKLCEAQNINNIIKKIIEIQQSPEISAFESSIQACESLKNWLKESNEIIVEKSKSPSVEDKAKVQLNLQKIFMWDSLTTQIAAKINEMRSLKLLLQDFSIEQVSLSERFPAAKKELLAFALNVGDFYENVFGDKGKKLEQLQNKKAALADRIQHLQEKIINQDELNDEIVKKTQTHLNEIYSLWQNSQ